MQTLNTQTELDDFLAGEGPRWLLKHSNACPVSFAALDEVKKHLGDGGEAAAMVVIQDNRPLSNAIAEKLGYVHQSPQLFLLDGGTVRWNASHWGITAKAMSAALA